MCRRIFGLTSASASTSKAAVEASWSIVDRYSDAVCGPPSRRSAGVCDLFWREREFGAHGEALDELVGGHVAEVALLLQPRGLLGLRRHCGHPQRR